MIFTVGNSKGGVGKSTCAVQLALGLAIEGERVWLIDGDRQETSLSAITARADSGRPMIAASAYAEGATLRAQVMQQRANYDHVVIDAGGRDSTALRAALTVSDAVLIPFLPRSFDVWALADIAQIVDESRAVADLRAFAFVNRADPQSADNREAAEAVAEYPGLELLDVRVSDRKAFANASGAGLHVEEMKRRDQRACAEIDRLRGAFFAAMSTVS
ncbi:gp40 [Burkholderia phage KS14]|uniref:Gp40 n=2 Tax=Kisquattuordecimvirus TaxID=2732982 RepID=E5FFJ3_9CAUD|nr:AAA family ATPase [Burkholderia vietnamiensis]YP_004306884.1 ParA-like partition protein [Burkholderia phage KS14]ADP02385.1 gp40 [Burkholderia phage KS14]KVS16203.1 chromosome partitioning protein ParA [Burkholderia vietnamiensis]